VLHRTTPRWASSSVTLGRGGRLGVTALLFVPVWFGITFNLFFLIGAVVWLLVLPMALHEIWQPAGASDDPAWPVGLPAQPVGLPAQPVGLPAQPVGLPTQPVGPPIRSEPAGFPSLESPLLR
jgi:hypothetical protein